MLALAFVLATTVVGLFAAAGVRTALPGWARVGLGLAVGQGLLVWLPFLLSLAVGLHAGARVALAVVLAAAVGLVVRSTRTTGGVRPFAGRLRAALTDDPAAGAVGGLALALTLLFAWLLHTHYLRPDDAGGLRSAGVTWGDLTIHAALATSFLERGALTLEHPFMAGAPLGYPFLPDHSVAVLASLATWPGEAWSVGDLRLGFVLGGLFPLVALALLVPAAARSLTGATGARPLVLATALFFFSGGLGATAVARAVVVEHASPLEALRRVDACYQPAGPSPRQDRLPPEVRKANVVGNLLVAARGSGFGMALGLAALLLVAPAVREGRAGRRDLLLAGALAGGLPLLHAHSFVAVTGTLVVWGCLARGLGRRWLWLGLPWALLALPQAAWLATRVSTSDAPSARLLLGFLRPATTAAGTLDLVGWGRDLVVGLGVALVLWPLAWWRADPAARRLTAPLLLLLVLVNVWTFTPGPYENVKLVAWAELAGAALAGPLLAGLLEKRALFAALAFVAATTSGLLAVGHELVSVTGFLDRSAVAVAERVRATTPPDGVILTTPLLHHPVALLAGRRVLLVAPEILYTHGVDPGPRRAEAVAMLRGDASAWARWSPVAVVLGPGEVEALEASAPGATARLAARFTRREEVEGWTIWSQRGP